MSSPDWSLPTTAQTSAAEEIANVIVQLLQSERGVHAETTVSAAGRLAGTFLIRSFELDLSAIAPGTPIFSEDANERGPLLFQTLSMALSEARVPLDGSRIGEPIPSENAPQLSILEVQARLEPAVRAIVVGAGLDLEQSAHACALAAGQLIARSTAVLEPHVGFMLAAQGFVEGSKTAPMVSSADG